MHPSPHPNRWGDGTVDLATRPNRRRRTAAAQGVEKPYFLAYYDHLLVYAADGCGSATCEPARMTELDTVAMAPSVAGGVVHLGVGQTIHAFDVNGCGATTCEPLASVPAPGSVISISVAEGRLYANTVTAFASTQ
jgi:hypothetical protein